MQLLVALMVRGRCDSCWNSCLLIRSTEQPCGRTSLYSRCTAGVATGTSQRVQPVKIKQRHDSYRFGVGF